MTGSSMSAAILTKSHQPLVVDAVGLPKSLGFGQVLVKVHLSGVCASQVHEISALKGPDPYLPHLLGHEGAATVEAVGEGVVTVGVGDSVVMHWRPGAGLQSASPEYLRRGAQVNAGSVTTFNSWAVVSENRVTRVPAWLDHRWACLLGCALTTGFGVVSNDGAVTAGQSVVVFGVGGVGLSVILAARLASAHPIIAADLHGSKLEIATSLGASDVVTVSDPQSTEEAIRDLVGAGADVCIDTTGVGHVAEMAYRLCGPVGRTVLVGVPDASKPISIPTLPLHFGKVLTGSHGGSARPHIDIPRLVRLIEVGKLDLTDFPFEVRPLAAVNEALDALAAGVPGRQLLSMP